jgi:hypothetical protein
MSMIPLVAYYLIIAINLGTGIYNIINLRKTFRRGFDEGWEAYNQYILRDMIDKYEIDLNLPEHQHIKYYLEAKHGRQQGRLSEK